MMLSFASSMRKPIALLVVAIVGAVTIGGGAALGAPDAPNGEQGSGSGATGYDPAVTSLTIPEGGTVYTTSGRVYEVPGVVTNHGNNLDVFTVTFRVEFTFDFMVTFVGEPGDTVQNGMFCGSCGGGNNFYSELSYLEWGGFGIEPGEDVPVSRDILVSCPNPSLNFLENYDLSLSVEGDGGDDNPADSQMSGGQSHYCVAKSYDADPDGDTIPNGSDPDDDNDGCPDSKENMTGAGSELAGGRRDMHKRWDYFNPSHDGVNRVDDILLVVQAYFDDDSDGNPGLPPYAPGYNPDTDRTLVGPNAWNLGPPNGLQRVDDILNQVKQYFHDCS